MTTNSTAFDDGSENIVDCLKEDIDDCFLARNDFECDCQNGSLMRERLIQQEGYNYIIDHACSYRGDLLKISILYRTLRSEEA